MPNENNLCLCEDDGNLVDITSMEQLEKILEK